LSGVRALFFFRQRRHACTHRFIVSAMQRFSCWCERALRRDTPHASSLSSTRLLSLVNTPPLVRGRCGVKWVLVRHTTCCWLPHAALLGSYEVVCRSSKVGTGTTYYLLLVATCCFTWQLRTTCCWLPHALAVATTCAS
jgi:hypothetical protein